MEERPSVCCLVLSGGGVVEHAALRCGFPEHVGDGLGCGVKVASFRCLREFLVSLGVRLYMKCEVCT